MKRWKWLAGLLTLGNFRRFNCAQPEHATRNLVVQTEITEVFASHDGRPLHDVIGSERFLESACQPLSQFRSVVSRWRNFGVADFHNRRSIFRNPGGRRDILRDARD